MKARVTPLFPDNATKSPVDYDAARRGYNMPTKHKVIDELIYEPEWQVSAMIEMNEHGFRLLTKGEPFEEDISLSLLEAFVQKMKTLKSASIVAAQFLIALATHTETMEG